MSVQRLIESSRGYLDLGMEEEALSEISGEALKTVEGGTLALEILIRLKRWKKAVEQARRSIEMHPKEGIFYIQGAYAKRRASSVLAARKFLYRGQPHLLTEPIFYFNLACYDCVMGNLKSARSYLRQALWLSPECRKMAEEEKDLEPLWRELERLVDGPFRKVEPIPQEMAGLRKLLEYGNLDERREALDRLVEKKAENILLDAMQSIDSMVVEFATHGLWECWLNEKGLEPRKQMAIGIRAMNDGDYARAEKYFLKLEGDHPDWAEVCNKLASLCCLKKDYSLSLEYCWKTIALKPHHFGAWSGILMVAQKLEHWDQALQAARRLVELQPHSEVNKNNLRIIEEICRQST